MENSRMLRFQPPPLSQSLAGFGQDPGAGLGAGLLDGKAEAKQASVAAATESKQLALGGTDEDIRLIATAYREGHPMADSPMIQDMARYGEDLIAARYGPEAVVFQRRLSRALTDARKADFTSRTFDQQLGDAGRSVASGAVGGLGGIAAFGTGLVSDSAGAAVAAATRDATDWIHEGDSRSIQQQREQAAYRGELDRRDIADQYERDKRDGASFPGLRRFGREMVAAAEDLYEHPSLAADLTAEGIGSLAGSLGVNGVITKGAAKFILAQRGVTGARATKFLESAKGREFLRDISVKGMPASIGLLEGGGAYAGIQAEIQAMSESELMEGSAEYAELRKQGFTHEVARDRIANTAAMEGGVIQGLIGAATGKLVARFETDPLGLRGKGSGAVTNILKETGEEAIQSASGNIVAGHAIRANADANRDPFEGAGADTVQGAVAGAGMAASLQAPRLAVGTAAAGVRTAASAAGSVVKSRLDSVERKVDEKSTTGRRATNERVQETQETLTTLSTALKEERAARESSGISPESTAPEEAAAEVEVETLVEQAAAMTAEEANATPDPVRKLFLGEDVLPEGQVVPRLATFNAVAEELESGSHDEATENAAALWLFDQARHFETLRDRDLSALEENKRQAIEVTQEQLTAILENPTIARMVERAQELTQAELGPLPEITDQNVDSPEVQRAVEQTVALSRANPTGVDPRFIRQILSQVRAGKLAGLSPRIVNRLESAATWAEEVAEADRQKLALKGLDPAKVKTRDIVRSEILSEGRNAKQQQWSLKRHRSEIEQALDQGRVEEAQTFLDNLRGFGQHFHNKVRAAKQSFDEGKGRKVKYDTWTGTKMLPADHESARDIYVQPKAPDSVATGIEAVIDARTVVNLYNNLLKTHGDQLKGQPLPRIRAPKGLEPDVSAPRTPPKKAPEAKTAAEEQARDVTPAKAQPAAGDSAGTGTTQAAQAEGEKPETSKPETSRKSRQEDEDRGQGKAEAEPAPRPAREEPAPVAESREEARDEDAEVEAEPAPVEGAEQDDVAGGSEGDPAELDPGVDADDADGGVESSLPAPDFSNLVPSRAGLSRFVRAYAIDPARSLFMSQENPARYAVDVLKNIDRRRDELAPGFIATATKAKQVAEFVEGEAGRLVTEMNRRLTRKAEDLRKGKYTPLEALDPKIRSEIQARKDGGESDLTSLAGLKSLNIVDPETGKYDPRLVQAAALAALHWVMNAPKNENLDVEDVASFFGVSEADVDLTMMQAATWGVRGLTAKESLARTILEFWGAQSNPDAPMSDSLGIAQAVAAELLEVMDGRLVETKTFEIKKLDANGDEKPTTPVSVRLSHPETAEQVRNIGGMKRILADAFLPQARKPHYFDEVPTEIRKTQKRNPLGRLGRKMLQALGKHQEIRFYRNTPYVLLMQALGQENYARLMGARDIDADITNKIDAVSIEGRNTQLLNSWEGVVQHNEELETYAETNGKSPDEVATHFDWYVVSNERIHAEGFNPQADKGMREAFAATVSTLDLTTQEGRDQFWITVAQSIGVKTEKANRDANIAKAQELIGVQYQESVTALEGFLETGALSEEDLAALHAEMAAEGPSPKLLHALLAVARHNLALAEGGDAATSFRHSLALEADGKTDGPINAMAHFISGKFSWDQVRNLARGGFFLGSGAKTLNELGGEPDLYQAAANRMVDHMARTLREIYRDRTARPQAQALTELMNDLLGAKDFRIDWEAGEIEIGRGTLKNPLTITVYGSGERGIAGKVANGLMEVIYARMSEAAANGGPALSPEMEQRLRAVTTQRAYFDEKTDKWRVSQTVGRGKRREPASLGNLRDVRNFEFTPANRQMLLENILTFFVDPMSQAIGEMMGGAQKTLRDFQAATQIQSAVLSERFQQAVRERLKEKRAAGELESGEFLTQKDYDAIFRELAKYGAVIEGVDNDAHHLNLSNRKSAPSQESFSRSFSARFGGRTSIGAPSDAGVSASPMITISRGDAMMMVNFFASQEIPDGERLRTLPVFDGLEMPADGIETISEMINKAVADSWLENPAQDVADSFADWMRQGEKGPFEGIQAEETIRRMARSLGIPVLEDKLPSITDIRGAATDLRDQLQATARSIQARKNTYKRVGFSVDHMASGESPYVLEGEAQAATDASTDLVDRLNRIYDEELAKLEEAAGVKSSRPAVEAPSKELQARVEQIGTELWDGIFEVNSRNVLQLLSGPGVSRETLNVARTILKAMPGYKFYFGSAEALTKMRNELTPEYAEAGPIENGQIDRLGRAIYIANTAGETVLHEMLHAATADMIDRFYGDPGSLEGAPRDALENLERLMGQFMGMDFSAEAPGVVSAARTLQGEIRTALSKDDDLGKARALHEFVAWSLSNQSLIDVMRKSRVRTPLRRLAFQALGFVRRLFGLNPGQNMDMFSNIALNVNAILGANRVSDPDHLPGPLSPLLNQVSGHASDPRLDRLMQEFDAKIAAHLRTRPIAQGVKEAKNISALADEAVNLITSGGFTLDPQQQSAFRSIQAALASSMQLDGVALTRIQKLFTHVLDQIDLESFNDLVERYGSLQDPEGRSTLMASFLALSQVDPAFRKVLAEMRLPKGEGVQWKTADEFLNSTAETLLEKLALTISGEGRGSKTALQSLDRLAEVLARIEQDDRTQIEKEANRLLGVADDAGSRFLSRVGERLSDFADGAVIEEHATLRQNTRALLQKGAGVVGAILNEEKGKQLASALTSAGNTLRGKPWVPVLEMMSEVFGVTDENRAVYELINKVKYAISHMRQEHRQALPKILAEQFSRKLTKDEWTRLHLALGRTDIATLVQGGRLSLKQIRKALSDQKALAAEIATAEEIVKGLAPRAFRDYFRKADELAKFMVTGETSDNLARNAEALAHLFDEPNQKHAVVTEQSIQAIDELVTLYALDKLDPETRTQMAVMNRDESKGVDFLVAYLTDLRRQEAAKHAQNTTARLNGWKGYVPAEARSGARLIVADDRRHNELVTLGYTRLGDYRGSGVEKGAKGYYFSTVAGRNTYNQGVMQTVQTTAFGVDPRTGYTLSGITAGRITGPMVKVTTNRLAIQRRQKGGRKPVEHLLPVRDASGEVVAYERSLAPERLKALDRNTHLGEMIGAWAGRQAEEELAQGFNRMLVDRVHNIWGQGKKDGRSKEFVDLSDESLDDPILVEAWGLIPAETRAYIREKFGEEGFMVRRNMLNNTVGYRGASVADLWTGNSRLGEETRKAFTDAATVVLGKNAFPWLVQAEKGWQAGVSTAKNIIVILSVVVPVSNIASNVGQLLTLGVGPRSIGRGFRNGLVEIDQHLKNLERKVEIKALKARHHDDPAQLRKLEAEEKFLDDASRRLSIWPLIEAGEFTTISEGLTEADAAITQGRLADWLREKVEKVPARFGEVGRYAAITRDTALFKGMSRATQYGDFLAKAVLYEHLTKRKGQKSDEALGRIREEFVQYNFLPGRTRSYAESMGITWFWAYKLRSIKVAYRMVRDNPVRALLTSMGGGFLPDMSLVSVGSPITDNFLSVVADGRLGYSIGPDMLFEAPGMHPWVALAN